MSTENQTDTEKQKLTDQQLRIAQIVAGLLCAAALVVSIFLSGQLAEDNSIMQYLFLIVFVVVMIGRRQVEKRYRLRLNLFSLAMIDGIVVGILIYTAQAFYSPAVLDGAEQTAEGAAGIAGISDPLKILILVGVFLLMLVLGVLLPLRRYFKRKAEGKEIPIRLPEPEEQPEVDDEDDADSGEYSGMSPIEQQIMEMTRELEQDGETPPSNQDSDDDRQ